MTGTTPPGGRDGLAQLRSAWTRLGEADPLWAVCVDPARRGGRWDPDEFFASGRAEIATAVATLDQLGLAQRRARALDFGCGVGRLTIALADHFGQVTGVDIAPTMLEHARSWHAANKRCEFVANTRPDLSMFGDGPFDLVYSSLVLQHIPPQLALTYLAEFVRVVRPGGAVVVVTPERHRRTPRGLAYACLPHQVTGWIQRTVFDYPAPMQMHVLPERTVRQVVSPLQAELRASVPYPASRDNHWQMTQHFVAVGGQQPADSGVR